jgi:hypothetical protein
MSAEIVTAAKSATRCGFEDLAAQINEAHKLAREHAESAIEHAFRAGELLIESKSKLAHGKWLPWMRENVKFSERTAQSYMRLASSQHSILKSVGEGENFSVRRALEHIKRPLRNAYQEENDRERSEQEVANANEAAEVCEDQKRQLAEVFGGDVWAFATHLLERPFCRDDVLVDSPDWIHGFANKLLYQAKLPAVPSFALVTLRTYDPIPVLRIAPGDELAECLDKLMPIATRDAQLPMLVSAVRHVRRIIDTAELLASFYCGAILEEFDYRETIDDETFAAEAHDVIRRIQATNEARLKALEGVKAREFATPDEHWTALEQALQVEAAA